MVESKVYAVAKIKRFLSDHSKRFSDTFVVNHDGPYKVSQQYLDSLSVNYGGRYIDIRQIGQDKGYHSISVKLDKFKIQQNGENSYSLFMNVDDLLVSGIDIMLLYKGHQPSDSTVQKRVLSAYSGYNYLHFMYSLGKGVNILSNHKGFKVSPYKGDSGYRHLKDPSALPKKGSSILQGRKLFLMHFSFIDGELEPCVETLMSSVSDYDIADHLERVVRRVVIKDFPLVDKLPNKEYFLNTCRAYLESDIKLA